MKTRKQSLIGFAVFLLHFLLPVAQAATPPGLPILGTPDPFSIPTSNLRSDNDQKMPVSINEIGTIKRTQQFDNPQNIYALSITGQIGLNSETSSVKIILVDNNQQNEYLVYETYPFLNDNPVFQVQEVCEETCLLSLITSFSLRFELEDASIQISELTYADTPIDGDAAILKTMRDTAKIKAINEKNLGWVAGETSVSKLSYEEKKRLFEVPEVPNLQGFEYYLGGIFEITSDMLTDNDSASSLVEEFDWRNRHGENWITSIKDQASCGSCWAFAVTGTIEAITNLYFNQHLDLDLAEQHALSCSGQGSCDGGYTSGAVDFYTENSMIDEACFPYSATDQSCHNQCNRPNQQIQISDSFSNGSTEDSFKKMIIENGPVTTSVHSWSHAMVLVGFQKDQTDQKTVWIFKNSWGVGHGDNGYAYLQTSTDNLTLRALQTPVISSNNYSINCVDNDGDQYCNWGISKDKPSTCPSFCKAQPDCDDSNPNAWLFDANYNCGTTPTPPVEQQFTIHNDGNGTLSVTSIAPETSAPWIAISTPTPFDVSPGSSKSVSVRVDFSQAPAGQRTTRLLVRSNDPDENPYPNGVDIVVVKPQEISQPIEVTTTEQPVGSSVAVNDNASTFPAYAIEPASEEIPIDYFRDDETGDIWGDIPAWQLPSPTNGIMPLNMWEFGLRALYLAKYACLDEATRTWMPSNIAMGIYYCTNPEQQQTMVNLLRGLADRMESEMNTTRKREKVESREIETATNDDLEEFPIEDIYEEYLQSRLRAKNTFPVYALEPALGEIPIDYYRHEQTGDIWGDMPAWQLPPPTNGTTPLNMWEFGLRALYLAKYACLDEATRTWMPNNIAMGIYYCTNPEDTQMMINHLRGLADRMENELYGR